MKTTAAWALSLSISLGLSLAGSTLTLGAEDGPVRSLMSKDLISGPGKELLMLTVDYKPGESSPMHTHPGAQALVYVLEGSIVMQVKGGPVTTLKAGQTWYEGPDNVHVVSRNASDTIPAKYLVVQVKPKGTPILTPVKPASEPSAAARRQP